MKVVAEGVGPEQHGELPFRRLRLSPSISLAEPGVERLTGKGRYTAVRSDTGRDLGEPSQQRCLGHGVGESRSSGGQARPDGDEAHRVGAPWPEPALVVMGKELGFVGRHVDVHRALLLAALAGETEIQRLFHVLVSPPTIDGVALQHLEERSRPPTSGVCPPRE